jgi:hypothetical protein
VQAPKRRDTKAPSNPLADWPRWVWVAGGGFIVGIAIVVAFVVSSGGGAGSTAPVKAAMLAAGCTYRDVLPKPPKKDPTDQIGGYHADVPSLTTPTKGLWSTSPPSGGAHYQLWAVWGFYLTAVNPRQVVHDEEHGAVVIWWGPKVSKATIAQLQGFYDQQTDGVFGTPYASLGNKIALTSWTGNPNTYYHGSYGIGHIAICPAFNQKAFATFRSAFRGKGPEGIPLSADREGCGPDSTSGCS